MMIDYYHVSRGPVPMGTVLESRYFNAGDPARVLRIVQDAASSGPETLRLLLLTEALIDLKTGTPSSDLVASAYTEVLYEEIRAAEFPERPSRLDCVFLLDAEEGAERWRQAARNGKGAILICDIEAGDPFRADMNALLLPDVHSPDVGRERMVEAARAYWSGDLAADARTEVLVSGRVVVLRQLAQPLGTRH
jgi:hypothetical protein